MTLMELVTAIATNGLGLIFAAAVLWLVRYRETKTIPDMLKAFSDSLEHANQAYDQRTTRTLETFTTTLHKEREVSERRHAENLQRHDDQRQRLDQILIQVLDNNHYLRDIALQLGVHESPEDRRRRQEVEAGKTETGKR